MKRYITLIIVCLLASLQALAQTEECDSIVHESAIQYAETSQQYEYQDPATAISSELTQIPDLSFDYTQTRQWRSYKKLRTIGWTFLGVGVPVTAGGFALLLAAILSSDETNKILGPLVGVTLLGGSALTVASIPILTVAYVKRYQAKHMKLDFGMTALHSPSFNVPSAPLRGFTVPAPSLTLTF